jgi:hypothetical protein
MKLFKLGLRLWIMLTSVLSFLMGWILLAHAPKPVQPSFSTSSPASVDSIPTLAPLPSLDAGNGQNNGNIFQSSPFSVQPPVQSFSQPSNNFAPAPVFRTSGS